MNKPKPPKDFDENPIWTEEMWAAARPASEIFPPEIVQAMLRPLGRPPMPDAERKQNVSLRLSPEVVSYFKATGKGWQSRIDSELLKIAKRKSGKAA